MLKNTQTTYGSVAKFFHWVVFFLVAFMLVLGYFMVDIDDKPLRGQVINIHKLIGLTILLLMLLRATWASVNPKPILLNAARWEHFIERLMHYTLYVVLIAMPLFGWTGSVAGGYIPHLFSINFNLPVPQNKTLSDICFSIHNTLAVVIIVLVSLHILAALYHHFIKKDNILLRMMPGSN